MTEFTMLQIVALALSVVEGVKVVVKGFTGKELNEGAKVLVAVLIGGGLAAFAEFAPDAWGRALPIVMVALAVPGLYSIVKRGGTAVVNGVNGNK
jgi:hypothetical protein